MSIDVSASPNALRAVIPAELLAVSENSCSVPDVFELIKNLWLFSSKLALTPASLSFDIRLLTVISAESCISVVFPSAVI